MPAFTLWLPFTHVILSLIDCTMSVPTNGQRGSCPNPGARLTPCPDDCALNPDGSPKLTCGSRFSELLPWKMRGRGIGPCASFNGSRLSAYVLVPPVAVESTASIGFTPCLPRVTPYENSLIRFGEKVCTSVAK